ncbi:MAG: hypothetical protein ACREOZ_02875 [Gloeomargaritales cyanobacterium]
MDLTGDGGKTWTAAEITKGCDQKYGRAWAWVFWTCTLPAKIGKGKVKVYSKALDFAYNVQPEKCDHIWNVRGLSNNSWFKSTIDVE